MIVHLVISHRAARQLQRHQAKQARRRYLASKPRCACHRALGRCARCCQTCGSPHAAEYSYPDDSSAGCFCPPHAVVAGFCRCCGNFCAGLADDFDENEPDWNSYERELRP